MISVIISFTNSDLVVIVNVEIISHTSHHVIPFTRHVFYAKCLCQTLILFASPKNLCYNNSHGDTENIPKNTMPHIHNDPVPLGHLLRRVLCLGDHGDSLRRATLLCKPFFRHHLRSQTSSHSEISVRAGFRRTGVTICLQKSQRKTTVTLYKADCITSFF